MYQSAVCVLVSKQINCTLIDEFTKHERPKISAIAFEMNLEIEKKASDWLKHIGKSITDLLT